MQQKQHKITKPLQNKLIHLNILNHTNYGREIQMYKTGQ